MDGQQLMEKILDSYAASFDIVRQYEIEETVYDAYAVFNVTSSKYVLMKKAELWRANCFEHTFFSCQDMLRMGTLEQFKQDIIGYIEPRLVRNDEKCTPENHMYTYITGIFFSQEGVSAEIQKAIREFKFFKNYRMGLRGYSQARLLVFDMENQKIFGNPAARDLVKGYKKVF